MRGVKHYNAFQHSQNCEDKCSQQQDICDLRRLRFFDLLNTSQHFQVKVNAFVDRIYEIWIYIIIKYISGCWLVGVATSKTNNESSREGGGLVKWLKCDQMDLICLNPK